MSLQNIIDPFAKKYFLCSVDVFIHCTSLCQCENCMWNKWVEDVCHRKKVYLKIKLYPSLLIKDCENKKKPSLRRSPLSSETADWCVSVEKQIYNRDGDMMIGPLSSWFLLKSKRLITWSTACSEQQKEHKATKQVQLSAALRRRDDFRLGTRSKTKPKSCECFSCQLTWEKSQL